MDLVHKVLSRDEFAERPPVLVDVGSSSGVHQAWRVLAPYSICLAFDPDSREMKSAEQQSKQYKKLHIFPYALTDSPMDSVPVFLTRSPACSSTLKPQNDALDAYEFRDRFKVVSKVSVQAIHLVTALTQVGLDWVDWFKTDSQGIDLRLFQSLGCPRLKRVIVAELEPGIIDAYEGEDKLWQVMSYMSEHNFWVSDMKIKGSQRFNRNVLNSLTSAEKNYAAHLLKIAPAWAEMIYVNSFAFGELGMREYLLGWVCAAALGEYGFAGEVAAKGMERFEDDIFAELKDDAVRRIRYSYLNFPKWFPLFVRGMRKWKRLRAHAVPQPSVGPPARSQGADRS